jgi:hypothetical protein
MKSNLSELLRVIYLDGRRRAPRGFKRRSTAFAVPVTQKRLCGQRGGARLRTSSQEKKTHRICAIPRRAVGDLSNQYLIICVGLSAVLARAVPGTYSVRTEFYAIHKQLLRV